MSDARAVLAKLHQNLNILREREAKYAGNAPLDLLHQIKDHQKAVALTEQVIAGKLSQAEWREALRPLLVAIDAREGEAASSVTIGDIRGGIYGSEIAGRDLTIGQKIVNIFSGDVTQQRDQRNRQVMLRAVKEFWVKGVLENSLYNAVLLELGLVEKKEAVAYPWELVLQAPHQPNRTLAPGTKLIDIFDHHQTLLILGEPGAGKTTMLLELARQTIARAEIDLTQPMPVVFNLSSWQAGQSLAMWLMAELSSKYFIPKKIAQLWLEHNELLLLLDGLDEIAPGQQAACVQVINDFRQEQLAPMVVCTRVADYEMLTNKLKLSGAVLIQPLTPQQVEAYLAAAGPELEAVRAALRHDEPLQELAQSPLMLSTMTLAYGGLSPAELPALGSVEARRQHLFEAYVQRMFERRGLDQRYAPTETKRWLARIAQKMSEHNQSLFLIERLQPSWLSTARQRAIYTMGYGLFTGLVGGLFMGFNWGLVQELLLWLGGRAIGWGVIWNSVGFGLSLGGWFGLAGLIAALVFSVVDTGRADSINTVELLRWSWAGVRNIFLSLSRRSTKDDPAQLKLHIVFVTVLALSLVGYAMGQQLGMWILGIIAGLGGCLFLLAAGLTAGEIEMNVVPNQGTWQSARNAVVMAAISGLGFGLSFGLPFAIPFGIQLGAVYGRWIGGLLGLIILLAFGWAIGSIAAVIGGFRYGGLAVIQHFVLRLVLYRSGHLPWNLADFLDYAANRIFLRKVGGGYIFIHRYLLEYFAALEPE